MASQEPTLPRPAVPRPAPLLGPTTASSVLVGGTCLVALLDAWAAWYHHGVATQYVAGVPGVWVADLTSADSTDRTTDVLYLLAMVSAAVALLVWLSRIRGNARLVGRAPHSLWRRLAVGGWFVMTVVAMVVTFAPGTEATVAELETLARIESFVAVAQCVAGALVLVAIRQTVRRPRDQG